MRLTLDKNFLDHAEEIAMKRGLYDFPIVDADCHYMTTPMSELSEFVEEPWKRRFMEEKYGLYHASLLPRDLGDRTIEGRMKSMQLFKKMPKPQDNPLPQVIYPLLESSKKMAIDYSIVFPTDLLLLGMTPRSDYEVTMAFAYARWMTEKILPYNDSLLTMLYLPFSNPEACLQLIKEFGSKKGVVGGLVTSVRSNQPVYHNAYMPLYKLMEEEGMTLGFHTLSYWPNNMFHQFNRFLSVHALGFPLYNMIHLINLLVNGIPERFPGLKILFIEAGVSWIPFLMQRLDSEYTLRSAEAPLLKKKPSEYIRNFYFTSQPLEFTDNMESIEYTLKMFDAENQLLYASDYPHQDFDLPTTIYDLPFFSEKAKRKILGENAIKLFDIKNPVLHAKESNYL